MEMSLEDNLFQAIRNEDQVSIANFLSKGANPNKTTSYGKTCLGESAIKGNIKILKLLLSASKPSSTQNRSTCINSRKRTIKCHKRKLKQDVQDEESVVKCKTLSEKKSKDYHSQYETFGVSDAAKTDKNQGYFVFIHSDGSSSEDNLIASLKSSLSPSSLTPSPQADLEWDEEIGNVAPSTSEDETWTSMYKWYAAILESTGAAIASASMVSYGIDQQDTFMRTALHYASEEGHAGIVKLLIDAGCKLDITAGDGMTPLHISVIKNHVEIVKLLLEAGSYINYKTHEKMTPLHFAASRGFVELVKMLLEQGACLEARDTNERSALYLAAGRGHTDVVKHLIFCGANINGEEIHGYTPLCEAVWQRYASVVEILLVSGARITHSHRLLHNAIIQQQVKIIKMLANYGGGINLHNDNGDTPLLLAVRVSQPNVVRLLLQKGANVNSSNSITGANALHIAVESVDTQHFEELLKCLIEYKIDMDTTALTGDTALNRALLLQRDHAAVLLIRYGADVNACDLHFCGLDNLSVASRRNTNVLARMLIKAGHYTIPDPNPPIAKTGTTTNWLYYACKQPLRLLDICRIKIRFWSKNRVLYSYVSSLPLPHSLKQFIMLEDEGNEYIVTHSIP